MAHTPTPWKLEQPAVEKFVGHMVFIEPAENRPYRGDIAHIQGSERVNGITDAEAMANAAFIVRAVNAHAALVEALGYLVRAADNGIYEPHPAWDAARDALALAKGETER